MIVSRQPLSVAPTTAFVIDLERAECTEVVVTPGDTGFALVGAKPVSGPIVAPDLAVQAACSSRGLVGAAVTTPDITDAAAQTAGAIEKRSSSAISPHWTPPSLGPRRGAFTAATQRRECGHRGEARRSQRVRSDETCVASMFSSGLPGPSSSRR